MCRLPVSHAAMPTMNEALVGGRLCLLPLLHAGPHCMPADPCRMPTLAAGSFKDPMKTADAAGSSGARLADQIILHAKAGGKSSHTAGFEVGFCWGKGAQRVLPCLVWGVASVVSPQKAAVQQWCDCGRVSRAKAKVHSFQFCRLGYLYGTACVKHGW